ncbi:MAG TPA: hypothetical protein VH331_06680 [Allosphingosinicella sp.]|jgi:hypothetical protein|nr:hypothetical protein [Allosphingosinicella sp.]
MRRDEVERLDATRTHWVAAVVSPRRDWAGAPGCRKGARYLVDDVNFHASRDRFATFDSEFSCQGWVAHNRAQLTRALPGAAIRCVPLDRWLLGLD